MNTTPNQPYSNEHDELALLLPELVERNLPRDRQRQLEEFVMSQIHQDQRERVPRGAPKRRFAFGTSVLAAVAVVAAIMIGYAGFGSRAADRSTATGPSTTGPSTPSGPSAATRLSAVELAAAYAAATPFTPPRPDQWIYVETRITNPGAVAKAKGQKPVETGQSWHRADGTKMSAFNDMTGKLDIWDQDNGYPELCALPTDPQALIAKLRAEVEATPTAPPGALPPPRMNTDSTPDEMLFGKISSILQQPLLPPTVTAALWRAMALVSGVTQSTVELDGRQVTAVAHLMEGWRFEQLLLDPDTHEFVGYRAVAAMDHTDTTPNGPITEKKGDIQVTITLPAVKVVDAPGRTS